MRLKGDNSGTAHCGNYNRINTKSTGAVFQRKSDLASVPRREESVSQDLKVWTDDRKDKFSPGISARYWTLA